MSRPHTSHADIALQEEQNRSAEEVSKDVHCVCKANLTVTDRTLKAFRATKQAGEVHNWMILFYLWLCCLHLLSASLTCWDVWALQQMVMMGLAKMKQTTQMEMIYHTGEHVTFTWTCAVLKWVSLMALLPRVTITNACCERFEAKQAVTNYARSCNYWGAATISPANCGLLMRRIRWHVHFSIAERYKMQS